MNQLKYRKATQEDVENISALAEKIWKVHYREIISKDQIHYMLEKMYSKDSLIEQMKKGHDFTLQFLNNELTGYLSISDQGHGEYFIHKFYIDILYQRKGFGRELLTAATESLRPLTGIELTVNRGNHKAIDFYFKNGFRVKEVGNFDIGKGFIMNDFILRRPG